MKNKENLREIISYFIFGVLTTAVGMGTYFGILWLGENVIHVAPDTASFNIVRVIAQILHWVFAVLFAFFTNKKWVFTTATDEIPTSIQLLRFSASRLATLGLDTAVTFGTVWILQGIGYETAVIIGIPLSADIISKIVASVMVLITNYVLSKLFVFKKSKQ